MLNSRDGVISALVDSNRQREKMINDLVNETVGRGMEIARLKRYIGILERKTRMKPNGSKVDGRKNGIDRAENE